MNTINYNRDLAISYAQKWALSRNPKYYNFDAVGGDCTSFVSQCLFAGSNKMNYSKQNGWYYNNGNDKSPSWSGVEFLYNFLTTNKGYGPRATQVLLLLILMTFLVKKLVNMILVKLDLFILIMLVYKSFL